MNTRAERFPLFDSLRALAALAVVVAHISFFGNLWRSESLITPFVGRLEVGVAMFFLISAFLIYRPVVARHLAGDPPLSVRAYGWRRALRVLPGYWIALTLVALWFGGQYVFAATAPVETFSAKGVLAYYGLTQLYFEDARGGGLPQAWTLSVEATFYVFLPLWALMIQRVARRVRVTRYRLELTALLVLACASVAYKWAAIELRDLQELRTTPTGLMSSLPAYLDYFALGMALAVWSAGRKDAGGGFMERAAGVVERRAWIPWAAAAFLFWVLATQLGLAGEPEEFMSREVYFARHFLLVAVAAGIMLPAVFGDPGFGAIRRLLANRVLLFVGLVSYGIYGYHLAVVIQLVRMDYDPVILGSGWLGWLVVVVPGSVAIGALSYYIVERPALSLKRLVPDRRGTADQPGAVSAPATPPAV